MTRIVVETAIADAKLDKVTTWDDYAARHQWEQWSYLEVLGE
ncbi:MAG TPA: hypothetical protein VLH56_19470 [Dissulfurispiraceae bacterium]|nr:hypothetical protein [Dissulfurispiraceae bacterium]